MTNREIRKMATEMNIRGRRYMSRRELRWAVHCVQSRWEAWRSVEQRIRAREIGSVY